MPNSYANLTEFKGNLIVNVGVTTHDTRLRELLESASRGIDDYLGRHMHSQLDTRYFSGNGSNCIKLPWDLISVTTLKQDTTDDGTYDTTWSSSDYIPIGIPKALNRYDVAPTGRAYLTNTKPYEAIEIDRRSSGSKSEFPAEQRNFELIGNFGFSQSSYDSTGTVGETYTSTDLTLTVDDGTLFAIGMTILIESEQLYITAISTNDLTVQRGINGTTAASHASGVAISIIEYPNPIREATMIEAGLLLETHGYRRQLGNFETGIITPFGRTFSAETRMKIDPFKQWNI